MSYATTEDEVAKLEHKIANPDMYKWADSGVIHEDGSVTEYWQNFREDC